MKLIGVFLRAHFCCAVFMFFLRLCDRFCSCISVICNHLKSHHLTSIVLRNVSAIKRNVRSSIFIGRIFRALANDVHRNMFNCVKWLAIISSFLSKLIQIELKSKYAHLRLYSFNDFHILFTKPKIFHPFFSQFKENLNFTAQNCQAGSTTCLACKHQQAAILRTRFIE